MLERRGRDGGGGGGAGGGGGCSRWTTRNEGGVGAPLTPTLAGGEGRQRLYAAAIRPVGAFARTLRPKRTYTRGHPLLTSASPPLLLSSPSNERNEKSQGKTTASTWNIKTNSPDCRVSSPEEEREAAFHVVGDRSIVLPVILGQFHPQTAVKSSSDPRCPRTPWLHEEQAAQRDQQLTPA